MPPKTRRASREEASTSRRASREEASTSRRRTRARSPTPPPSPPPSPLPWPLATREQTQRYKVLHRRKVISSKFFDPYTLNSLGLRDQIHAYVDAIGWTTFAGFSFPTYKEITYEILSTVHASFNPYDESDEPCIFFRCLGVDRALTMAQFNGIFGFPNHGISWNTPAFNPHQVWHQLTGLHAESYDSGRSKSTALPNHTLRYIHRVMAHSIFGRGLSQGVVNRVELMFLWAMVNGIQINSGVWFLKHLLHVARMPSGNICIGGLLSVIAHAFGFIPIHGIHRRAEGDHLVDLATLVNMNVCRHIGQGEYRLLDDEGQVMEQEWIPQGEEPEPEPMEPEEAHFDEHMQMPDMGGHNMGGQPEHMPPPPPDYHTQQILERLERLEIRISQREERSDAFEAQMLAFMQRQEEAIKSMRDRHAD